MAGALSKHRATAPPSPHQSESEKAKLRDLLREVKRAAGVMLLAVCRSRRSPETLGPHTCEVWALRVDEALAANVAEFRDWLDLDEIYRHETFRFDRDRRLFLLSHALVRGVLARHTGVEPRAFRFRSGPRGKPYIESPALSAPVEFSLSHTAGLAVCAVVGAGTNVGVDAEAVIRMADHLAIAQTALSTTERAELFGLAPDCRPARLATLWTLKEAYLKARGVGLSVPLADISLSLTEPDGARLAAVSDDDDPARWQLVRFGLAGYQISVAVRSASGGVAIHLRQARTPAVHQDWLAPLISEATSSR